MASWNVLPETTRHKVKASVAGRTGGMAKTLAAGNGPD
jgi:hypothetical protein